MQAVKRFSFLFLLGMLLSCASPSNNPLPVNMGDPFLLCPSSGGYYLYGTSEKYDGFITYRSSDLVAWEEIPQVFDTHQEKAWGVNCHWAPEVYERNGKYYLFYSANWKENPDGDEERFRIGVAVSDSPEGPFLNLSDAPLFDPGYPVIDANVCFDDEKGEAYLYYSRCCYKHPVESSLSRKMKEKGIFQEIEESWIYGVALRPDLSGTEGEPVLLLRPEVDDSDPSTEWENRSVLSGEVNRRWSEGPFVFKKNNLYYMIYSANFFGGSHYAMGYAVSEYPLGPYTKSSDNPVLQGNGIVTGTGHGMCTTLPSGKTVCVYHGRTAKTGHARMVFIDEMQMTRKGGIKIKGPTLKE